jgi:hypothetical protein
MKKIIIFTILALLLLPNLATAYVSISISATTTPSTIEPGQKANLLLTISNIGTTTAQNVKLKIKSHTFITPTISTFDLQSIPNGNSIQVTIPFTVSSSITEGTTALQFTIDYSDSTDPAGTRTQENSATISVTKRTLIEVNKVSYDKETIQPGDTIKMDIELKNVGKGKIKDLSVSIYNATLPFVPLEASSRFLKDLDVGEMKNATFNVIINKDAKTVANTIPVTLTYYDEFNSLHTETKYVGLKISGVPEFVVSIEKTEKMYAGNTGKISISVSNRGTAIAQFLTAEFDSDLYVTPKDYYVGNLDPDDSSTISLEINLKKVETGNYPLNMILKYKDPYNKEFSEKRVLQFDVVAQPIEISSTTQIIILLVIVGVLYWKKNSVMKLLGRK